MKKLLISILLSILFTGLFGQTIVLKDGTVINDEIEQVIGNKVTYYKKLPTGNKFVLITDIVHVQGDILKGRKKAILKRNPNVIFGEGEIIQMAPDPIYDQSPKVKSNSYSNYFDSSHYIEAAGKKYLIGTGLSIAGATIAVLGISDGNDDFVVIGGVTSLIGFVTTIIGHTDLINAGRMMRNEKKLSIISSNNGIGLAYKF